MEQVLGEAIRLEAIDRATHGVYNVNVVIFRGETEVLSMAERLDTSRGWCCDGRTWIEHTEQGGKCCQPEGQQIKDLPADGQRKARERMAQAGSG